MGDRLSREGEASKDVRAFAMREGLRRLYAFTRAKGQADRTWHVICESHSTAEDKRFLAAAQGVCDGENADGCRYPFELTMCPKTFNSAGLQYADLTAHSIGFEVLEPEAKSRSSSILRRKLWRDGAESGEEMPQEVIALPQLNQRPRNVRGLLLSQKAEGPPTKSKAQRRVGKPSPFEDDCT